MLKNSVNDFVDSRMETLTKALKHCKKYEIAREQEIKLSKEIMELLPKKDLFFQYEDCKSEVISYEAEKLYKMGFQDCFNLILRLYQFRESINNS